MDNELQQFTSKDMNFQTVSFWIGDHFLSALFYGDHSSLCDDEVSVIVEFEAHCIENYGAGHWSPTGDRSGFGRCEVTNLRGCVERIEWVYR